MELIAVFYGVIIYLIKIRFCKCQDTNLIVNSENPFNAETPPGILCNDFITPVKNFYVRNHGKVPIIDPNNYRLVVDGLVEQVSQFSLYDIKSLFPKHSIIATLMCAGNRRKELQTIGNITGTSWNIGAISNAKWSGAKLMDVLNKVKAKIMGKTQAYLEKSSIQDTNLHVQFEGFDRPKDNTSYLVSIPIRKASSLFGDVILAYEMNDAPLSANHGAPLRVIVPGYIGARSCKWLKRITIQNKESEGYFQQKDYKLYQPQVGINNIDSWYTKLPAIQESNVQSAICTESQQVTVKPFIIKGYAFGGGDRTITQVDVSLDGGSTWKLATLEPEMCSEITTKYLWSWTLWSLNISEPLTGNHQITVRAWDNAANTQPKYLQEIWNIRGLLNNAWHRVNISFKTAR